MEDLYNIEIYRRKAEWRKDRDCGEGLEVLVGKRWVRTRIEKAADWYLVGIDTDWLDGLRVRV